MVTDRCAMEDKVPLIFVFGSNLAGRHGRGAAKFARLYRGAKYGQGEGRQGNSYAIPTKDHYLRVLPLEEIELYVAKFITYAFSNRHLIFEVTKIGCGLAGYKEREIAPMFEFASPNCYLPNGW